MHGLLRSSMASSGLRVQGLRFRVWSSLPGKDIRKDPHRPSDSAQVQDPDYVAVSQNSGEPLGSQGIYIGFRVYGLRFRV